jgi:hypothetical protein
MELSKMTDWMVDKEFHPVFDRLSETVELKGAYTPDDIDQRIKQKMRAFDYRAKNPILTTHISTKKAKRSKKNLQKLIDSDFGTYTVAHARRHPDGIVNLTFWNGFFWLNQFYRPAPKLSSQLTRLLFLSVFEHNWQFLVHG